MMLTICVRSEQLLSSFRMAFPHGWFGAGLVLPCLGRLAVRPCLWGRDTLGRNTRSRTRAFIPVAHLDCSILPLTDQCLAPCRPVPPILRLSCRKCPRYCTTQSLLIHRSVSNRKTSRNLAALGVPHVVVLGSRASRQSSVVLRRYSASKYAFAAS